MNERVSAELEVRHLRAFLAVATERNFTRAASRLCMSQPALSRCVAQLERLVGEQLIHRARQQIRLTSAGARLLPHARLVLESIQNAVHAAVGEATRLRIGFTLGSSFAEIPLIVKTFENFYPGVAIDVICLDRQFKGLVNGLCDLEFVRGFKRGPDFRSTLLFQEPRIVALPSDHRLAGQARITMEDISKEPFVVAVDGMPSFDVAPLLPAGAEFIMVNNIDAWLIMIGSGRGIGITDKSIADFHNTSRVWFAELQDFPPARVWAALPASESRTECEFLVGIAIEVTKRRRAETPELVRGGLCGMLL